MSAAGWEVVAPRGQGCCGALHLHAGRLGEFRALAGSLVAAFPSDVDFVVTNAAGCGSALKDYGHWLPGADAETFAAKVRDVSEVLVEAELDSRAAVTVTYPILVTSSRAAVKFPPRALLRRIPVCAWSSSRRRLAAAARDLHGQQPRCLVTGSTKVERSGIARRTW